MPSNLVYTSIQLIRQQASSDLFKTFGNPGQAPTIVSNCGVYPLSYTQDPTDIASIVNNFGRCLAAPLRKSPIPLSGDLKYNITRAPSDLKDFFTPPDVVVSFGGGNLSEQVDVKMTQMGFRKDSQGRRAFYRGSLSKDKIPSILELGSKILSYTFALNSCIMTPMRVLYNKKLCYNISAVHNSCGKQGRETHLLRWKINCRVDLCDCVSSALIQNDARYNHPSKLGWLVSIVVHHHC